MRTTILLILALFLVGCGGEDSGDSVEYSLSLEYVFADTSSDDMRDYTKPDYIRHDSFIVGYDTTGVKLDSVVVDSVMGTEWFSRLGESPPTHGRRKWYYNYNCSCAFIVEPRYAPKVVVQLDSADYSTLMKIIKDRNPNVCACEAIFVTSGNVDFQRLNDIGASVSAMARELKKRRWQARGVDIDECAYGGDCGSCADRSVCSEVKKAIHQRRLRGQGANGRR